MTHDSDRRRRLRVSWTALGLYAFLALLMSWPVVTVLGSRVPGTATWAFDESTFVWNIWYFKHALLDLRTSPLHSGLIWYPLGIDLILYTYNFFNALIALPLQLAFNLPTASNLSLLFATTMSGFGTYLLACYVLRDACSVTDDPRTSAQPPHGTYHASRFTHHVLHLAAFLAGLIYAFASNRAIYAALGHYDMVTTQWLPFYALYLLKTLREPKLKNAVLAGLFFALAALAEMIFASFLGLFTAVIVLAVWRPWRLRWSAFGRLALAMAVAVLIWSPVLVPIAREFLTGDYALTGWGESVKLSADAVGLVTPTALNPIARAARLFRDAEAAQADSWTAALRAVEEGKSRFSDINTVFLGYVTLALAVLGAWVGRKRLRPWIWSALVFGVLALGPLLQINGRYRFSLDNMLPEGVTFPLPFTLLHFIPFINGNRAPNRNSAILMLTLAVLAGYGAAWLLGRAANGKWQIANSEWQVANGRSQASGETMNAPRSTLHALPAPSSTCLPVSSLSSSSPSTSPSRCRRPTPRSPRSTGKSLPSQEISRSCSCRWAGATASACWAASRPTSSTSRRHTANRSSAAISAARRPTRWITLPASRCSRP